MQRLELRGGKEATWENEEMKTWLESKSDKLHTIDWNIWLKNRFSNAMDQMKEQGIKHNTLCTTILSMYVDIGALGEGERLMINLWRMELNNCFSAISILSTTTSTWSLNTLIQQINSSKRTLNLNLNYENQVHLSFWYSFFLTIQQAVIYLTIKRFKWESKETAWEVENLSFKFGDTSLSKHVLLQVYSFVIKVQSIERKPKMMNKMSLGMKASAHCGCRGFLLWVSHKHIINKQSICLFRKGEQYLCKERLHCAK